MFVSQAIRVFFMLRALSLQLQGEPETQLPLTRPEDLIKTDDVLDLSKSDANFHQKDESEKCGFQLPNISNTHGQFRFKSLLQFYMVSFSKDLNIIEVL